MNISFGLFRAESLPLEQLQHNFALALNDESSASQCMLLDQGELSLDERLNIYRNNYFISLTEVLEATYPLIYLLVGDECFNALAKHHIKSQALNQADVSSYGESFNFSIEAFKEVTKSGIYIPDMARFEWAIDASRQKHDESKSVQVHSLNELESIAEDMHEKIRFVLHPSVIPFESQFSLFALREALLETNPHVQESLLGNIDINIPQQGFIQTLDNNQHVISTLEEAPFQLLTALFDNCKLVNIDPASLSKLQLLITLELIGGFTIDED